MAVSRVVILGEVLYSIGELEIPNTPNITPLYGFLFHNVR